MVANGKWRLIRRLPGTHTAGSKLRCLSPTKHTKNITSNFSQARSTLPDDG